MSNSQGFIIKSFDCLRNIQISKELHSIEKRILQLFPKNKMFSKEKKFSRIAHLDRKDFFPRQLKIKNEN